MKWKRVILPCIEYFLYLPPLSLFSIIYIYIHIYVYLLDIIYYLLRIYFIQS